MKALQQQQIPLTTQALQLQQVSDNPPRWHGQLAKKTFDQVNDIVQRCRIPKVPPAHPPHQPQPIGHTSGSVNQIPMHYQTTSAHLVNSQASGNGKVNEDKKAAPSSRKTKDIFAAARFNLGRDNLHKPISPETMNQIAELSFMMANGTLDIAMSAKSVTASKQGFSSKASFHQGKEIQAAFNANYNRQSRTQSRRSSRVVVNVQVAKGKAHDRSKDYTVANANNMLYYSPQKNNVQLKKLNKSKPNGKELQQQISMQELSLGTTPQLASAILARNNLKKQQSTYQAEDSQQLSAATGSSLFLPMRHSAQINNPIVLQDHGAPVSSASNYGFQNAWKVGKRTGTGTDDEGSKTDEETLNFIANSNYSQTINRVQGLSQAIQDQQALFRASQGGHNISQKEILYSKPEDFKEKFFSPDIQTRNSRIPKGFSITNTQVRPPNSSYQGESAVIKSKLTALECLQNAPTLTNSARDESIILENEFVVDQDFKHGPGSGGSKAPTGHLLNDPEAGNSNNKNKYFLHQPFMRSSYSKKGLVIAQPQPQQQNALTSLHGYQAKRKGYHLNKGTSSQLLMNGGTSLNLNTMGENIFPSIEDQHHLQTLVHQQSMKNLGNNLLSPNKNKNRLEQLKKNQLDPNLIAQFEITQNPLSVVGGSNNRTLIENFLIKQRAQLAQQLQGQIEQQLGNSPGSDILIKGQGVAPMPYNQYNAAVAAQLAAGDQRDSMMTTSYNFTNTKNNHQRRLMSARQKDDGNGRDGSTNHNLIARTAMYIRDKQSAERSPLLIKTIERKSPQKDIINIIQHLSDQGVPLGPHFQNNNSLESSSTAQGTYSIGAVSRITSTATTNNNRPPSKTVIKSGQKLKAVSASATQQNGKTNGKNQSNYATASSNLASTDLRFKKVSGGAGGSSGSKPSSTQQQHQVPRTTQHFSAQSTKPNTSSAVDNPAQNQTHSDDEEDEDDDDEEDEEDKEDTHRHQKASSGGGHGSGPYQNQGSGGYGSQGRSNSNYSFRPRKPIANPVEQQRQEYEKQMQLRHEAREKSQQYSLQNKNKSNSMNTYIICPGNNSQVVKRCMELRQERWEETTDFDTLFNFKWHPVSRGIKFDQVNTHGSRQLVNHFENHQIFTNKDQMFRNLYYHCESKKINVFDYAPLTFMLSVDSTNSAQDLERFVTYFTFIDKLLQANPPEDLKRDPEQMDNVVQQINARFLTTYMMSKDDRGQPSARMRLPPSHFQGHNIWILKATGFNRGRGIHVFNNLEDLNKLIKEYTEGTNGEAALNQQQATKIISKNLRKEGNAAAMNQGPNAQSATADLNVPCYLKSTSFVIQKYVEKPLLLLGRKFDIRVWVLVAHDQRCFLFKEGYIRTSCEVYTLSQESISKAEIHLTNNAVQKFASNYGKFEDGNQLSFADMEKILTAQAKPTDKPQMPQDYVRSYLIPKIKEQIIMSLESVKKKLKIGKGFFELFGYDFILDGEYNPWMIEVNTNPCLEESSKLLERYIPRMVNDMLKLTVDLAFPPKRGQQAYIPREISQFAVPGYRNEENMWEKIMNLDQVVGPSGSQMQNLLAPNNANSSAASGVERQISSNGNSAPSSLVVSKK